MQKILDKIKEKKVWVAIALVVVILLSIATGLKPGKNDSSMIEAVATVKNLDIYYSFSSSVELEGTVSKPSTGFSMDDIMSGNIDMGALAGSAAASAATNSTSSVISGAVDSVKGFLGQYIPALAPQEEPQEDENNLGKQVTVQVDEFNLGCLQVGSTVDVTITALSKHVTGTIESISDEAKNQQGVAYFSAIIMLADDPEIKVGMTAETKILNASAQNVITVPMIAIELDENDAPYVLVDDGKDGVKTFVEVGLNNGIDAEIKSGLAENQVVLYEEKSNSDMGFKPPMMG